MPQLTYIDLLHRASEKAKEARGIIDKALNGNRELTPGELANVERLGQESDNLRKQGEEMEKAERRGEWFSGPAPGQQEPIRPELPWSGNTWRPGEVRTFHRGEKISNGDGNLQIGRLLRGMISGKWDGAEPERRVMSTLGGSSGGILVPETLSMDLIDLFRAESVLEAAGMGIIPMQTQDLTIPVVESDPTALWVPENADFTESEPGLNWCKLTAKKLGVYTKASIELIEDSPMAAATLQNLLAVSIAQELDNAALFGNGVGEPRGITQDSRITKIDMGANGSALTDYSKILQAVQTLMTNNVPMGPGEISVIMSPREWATLAAIQESGGPYIGPPSWLSEKVSFRVASKLPVNQTKGTSDDASQVLVGRFSEMTLGIRTEINIEVSRSATDSSGSAFKKGQVWVRAYLRADIAIRRPSGFVIIDGVVPA